MVIVDGQAAEAQTLSEMSVEGVKTTNQLAGIELQEADLVHETGPELEADCVLVLQEKNMKSLVQVLQFVTATSVMMIKKTDKIVSAAHDLVQEVGQDAKIMKMTRNSPSPVEVLVVASKILKSLKSKQCRLLMRTEHMCPLASLWLLPKKVVNSIQVTRTIDPQHLQTG